MRFLLLLLPLIFFGAHPVHAVNELSLQERLESEKQNRDRLEGQMKNAEKELQATRAAMVKAAESIRANEELLRSLEERMEALSREENELTARLESDHAALAGLILALERIRRVPPEALIVRPGAPLQTAQSALLLQTILPSIHERATALGQDLDRLADIRNTLRSDRENVLQTMASLEGKYRKIEAMVAEREELYRRLNTDYEEKAAAVARMAKEAESMQDLLSRLRDDENRRQAGIQARRGVKPVSAAKAPLLPRAGEPRLPVSGVILTGFGDEDAIGAESQGLSIGGAPGGLVVAPMGGIVRFAGEFKNYGRLVILEHKDNYHSLIGGLENISIVAGQKLDAGEPIGKLPDSSSRGDNPALYYELRHKGQPVNPSAKFANLKS